jgi:hypothetical protein
MAKMKNSKKDDDKFETRFDKYYERVKVDLDALKKEHDPKDKELLALRIHYKRNKFLKREPDRSKKLC